MTGTNRLLMVTTAKAVELTPLKLVKWSERYYSERKQAVIHQEMSSHLPLEEVPDCEEKIYFFSYTC